MKSSFFTAKTNERVPELLSFKRSSRDAGAVLSVGEWLFIQPWLVMMISE
jgi:hypothetical protein